MSTPITKATSKPPSMIPKCTDANEPLPVIDILSFCAQNEHLKRREPQTEPSTTPQNISLFKASNFGIDGSFPPRISSWSCRTMFCRTPRVPRTRWSRTKSESSMVYEEVQQIQNPRSGFSSPCFQGSVTPVRYRHLSYTPTAYQQSSSRGLGEQNIFISKANLNKRPKKKHLNIRKDSNGNITSISESESRRSDNFRRTIDLEIPSASQTPDRENYQSELSLYRPNDAVLDDYKDEMFDYGNTISDDHRNGSGFDDEASFPCYSPIKKIDIKLPF